MLVFETWVKIELSLNTGSDQAGRQSNEAKEKKI